MAARAIRRALLSVWDKTGIVDFARALRERGIELISTGGTATALREAGLPVVDVSALTSFPEILDGRVKTLHPAVHAGLLARRDRPEHGATLEQLGLAPIDLLAVNLYPFEATAAAGRSFDDTVEMIDIGGPAMIRAAAKNHAGVVVLTDAADYAPVLAEMEASGGVGMERRRDLAAKAFVRTAAYDAAIAAWFARQEGGDPLPDRLVVLGKRTGQLRYGENPHQAAAFYRTGERRPGVGTAEQVQGKALGYNNLNDTDAAFELVAEFGRPAAVIVKHTNPCGVAVADTLAEAHARALAADPVSAFGGIVALNRTLDAPTAESIASVFTEVVIAPAADADARTVLARKEQLRLLLTGGLPTADEEGFVLRSVAGGVLAQARDSARVGPDDLQLVTRRTPSATEVADLLVAFTIVKHAKSNAVVFARDGRTVGIGMGQTSRVDAVKIAVAKAAELALAAGEPAPRTHGSVLASDAFFPFADGLEVAAAAGATACIQPGGSRRDAEVIDAANAAGMAMVFTGRRHFRH
jgi:phosphoribosylaminoimidazolecarboxamide formyltransferase/IMP cyclohydrolase